MAGITRGSAGAGSARFASSRAVVWLAALGFAAAGCRSGTALHPETSIAPDAAILELEDPGSDLLPLLAVEDVPEEALAEAPAEEALPTPEALQREALDLCQSAEELLDRGETEEAIAALDRAYELMLELPANGDGSYLQAKEDIRLLVADLIPRIHRSGQVAAASPATSWDLAMPAVDNEHVQREIRSMTTTEKKEFLEGYRRSGRYRPMILERLAEAGLPSQLAWLPLVESWFKVRAYSRAAAVGPWQFISSTGLRYGLTRDSWTDERYDPEKSTDAAIAYLSDLHGMFGDWLKALAAYNCGEARVQRLQRRDEEYLDFWDLYLMLPGETRRYVPRLLAALQIIEDPERYGIELPDPDPPFDLTTVDVERPVQLEALDGQLGLPAGTLAEMNPELRHKATPDERYALRVPREHAERLVASMASLPKWSRPAVEYATHRVRSGQTLSVIARRYGTSVGAIMRANNLRSAHRIRAGQHLRIPVRGGGVTSTSTPRPVQVAADGTHTVRRGDSLHTIARRYGTTVGKLKADNAIDSNMIHPGQRLQVGASEGSPEAGSKYRVSRGDTLGGIAASLGVRLTSLLRANGLSSRSTIYPGQLLQVPR
jgi:membrane-bound lytic murein transglycosylase D